MKIETRDGLTVTRIGVRLTQAETDVLRRASQLAEQIRSLAFATDPTFAYTDEDLMLAHLEHDAREAVEGFDNRGGGWVSVTETVKADPVGLMVEGLIRQFRGASKAEAENRTADMKRRLTEAMNAGAMSLDDFNEKTR